jgi:AbrB family looped-hinge helix DNA binding protein
MVSHGARMKEKGQITVPAEIRKAHELDTGSRLVFEDRGDYIALIPEHELVDRTAGALSAYTSRPGSMTPEQLHDRASHAIAAENIETLSQIEREHEDH